jgi:hypothetical protein
MIRMSAPSTEVSLATAAVRRGAALREGLTAALVAGTAELLATTLGVRRVELLAIALVAGAAEVLAATLVTRAVEMSAIALVGGGV